ncbi:Glycine-rich RNA-binding protein 3, mitochondrial [Glycine soja]
MDKVTTMAFFGRIGNLLRQTTSRQAIRCMSCAPRTKLFIGGAIIMDREIGRSRGFGFVTYISVGEASSAIQFSVGDDEVVMATSSDADPYSNSIIVAILLPVIAFYDSVLTNIFKFGVGRDTKYDH